MKIAIVTEAWHPQINGVVTTLCRTIEQLERWGHGVCVVSPAAFRSFPCPTYPEVPVVLAPKRRLARLLDEFGPDALHITTEGPLGLAGRAWCLERGLPFTTSFHTRFPEYLRLRLPVPLSLGYAYLRRFHGAAQRTLVPTPSMKHDLEARGFRNLVVWARGVDTELFQPREVSLLRYAERPMLLYVGRVAVEKNIEAFLALDVPGSKLVIGDGPARAELERRYPEVRFLGYKHGLDLAEHIAAADVFVFPSRTDTFGLVLLEAMACGVPAAAYPVTGPIDVIHNGVNGCVAPDLATAVREALKLDGSGARRYALAHSWQAVSKDFFDHLAPFGASATLGETVVVEG